ncbi:hypothetical protein VDGL01_11278 [Verticillium dahliae]
MARSTGVQLCAFVKGEGGTVHYCTGLAWSKPGANHGFSRRPSRGARALEEGGPRAALNQTRLALPTFEFCIPHTAWIALWLGKVSFAFAFRFLRTRPRPSAYNLLGLPTSHHDFDIVTNATFPATRAPLLPAAAESPDSSHLPRTSNPSVVLSAPV